MARTHSRSTQRTRDMDRYFNYREARKQAEMRYLPTFFMSLLAIPAVGALGYLAIQVWAYTVTGRIYWNYALPCIAIIGVFLLVGAILDKCSLPVDRY